MPGTEFVELFENVPDVQIHRKAKWVLCTARQPSKRLHVPQKWKATALDSGPHCLSGASVESSSLWYSLIAE